MSVYDCFHVWHTAVTDFNIVLVKDFMELVLSGEVSLDQFEEKAADVGGDVVVK